MTYPHTPGYHKHSTGETARAAAEGVAARAPSLRTLTLQIIAEIGPSTPERVFSEMTRRGVKTVHTTVRARCTELMQMGLLRDSHRRGVGWGGKSAIAWELTQIGAKAARDLASRRAQAAPGQAASVRVVSDIDERRAAVLRDLEGL